MARNKPTLVQDIIEIGAKLPWWAGIVLAALSYFGLAHYLASTSDALGPPGRPGQHGQYAHLVFRQFAFYFQFILPFLLLIGAAVSAYRRYRRTTMLSTAVKTGHAMAGLNWREFEQLVGEAFRVHGYSVTENAGPGADGGIDLALKKGGETFLVQCKQWRAVKVGVTVVRELYGVMAANGATGGFVVTSGRFTAEAISFAQGRNITLMDGPALDLFIGAHRPAPAAAPAQPAIVPKPISHAVSPACPLCGGAMLVRSAKRGPNAGSKFLGCENYPSCRATAALP